jgi:hypothetical protein
LGSCTRIGATGILKGVGKPEGWANKTFFYPDSTITETELAKGLFEFEQKYPYQNYKSSTKLTVNKAWAMIVEMQHYLRNRLGIEHKYPSVISNEWKSVAKEFLGTDQMDGRKLITRKELAVFLNSLSQNPFEQNVDAKGMLIYK